MQTVYLLGVTDDGTDNHVFTHLSLRSLAYIKIVA